MLPLTSNPSRSMAGPNRFHLRARGEELREISSCVITSQELFFGSIALDAGLFGLKVVVSEMISRWRKR